MKPIHEKIVERCSRAVEEHVAPGGIVGVVRANGERKTYPFGHLTYDIDAPFVTDETIYDVASITKSMPTASLALALIDKGALGLDSLVASHLPEFRNNYSDRVTIKHLLTYTIDGVQLSTLKDKTADEILSFVLSQDMRHEPGMVFQYSNTPALLLGLIVERKFGVGIAQAASDNFFKSLRMKKTGFLPQKKLHAQIAPSEGERGVVHDESARVFAKEGRTVGHAGLFSTAPDLLNFLEMVLNGGEIHGRRYFSNKIIREMATNQIPELGQSTGLGWELNQARFMGKHRSGHTFGKTGFTGTSVVCDIERDIAFAILTNRTYPQRSPDDSAINTFRNDIADAILVP